MGVNTFQSQVIPGGRGRFAEISNAVFVYEVIVERLLENFHRTLAAENDRVVILHEESAPGVVG